MRATSTLSQAAAIWSFILPAVLAVPGLPGLPDKIYGVNLGSWLVLESWMLPQECAFAKAFPDTVDQIFDGHWTSWFNQPDVDALKANGINTVRIPLGYWIVEALVDRATEFYPRGGLAQLRRGLQQLNAAGIVAILDHHALPGVAAVNQMFAGNCTSTPMFYTDANYHRALIWTSVMTTLSHVDSAFANVVAIEAVNEPIMDATQTPGYGNFQQNFVKVLRATEFLLGVPSPGFPALPAPANGNFTAMLPNVNISSIFTAEVLSVLQDAASILVELGVIPALSHKRTQLITNFMDVNWQFNDPPNPAAAANGPQGYDNHLYYVFGGVADPNPTAYLISICNLPRVQNDAALGNSPLWFGEWGLPVQFTANDTFLTQWADAQKLAYSKGAGWIFWNFKIEKSELAEDRAREWSYLEGVELGFLTKDPSQVHDPNVCAPYITATPAT
ncbi:Glycoside hydrolase family 5 protein [Mycena sanguinolenta]|uniref:Glycoside hydrolase family 5 protein n=1 Tax=Mycena sanguinolenta TaxID=230812 RepID=A0A8H6XQB3_9AGAR|nr:Glycoside hydrolase family 5 protein [Mycena sanguinolenta]